jgi:AcrR family transcriptional regulator
MARPIKTPFSPDLRATIGAVAEALFAERGFDGACIREIARRAGATTGLIYHYYGSKEDLYLTLMEIAASDLTVRIENIAAGKGSPPEKVRLVVRTFLDSYRAQPQHFQLVHRAIDDCSPAVLALAERWFSRVYQALQVIAEEGMREKLFTPFPAYIAPFIMLSLIIHALRNSRFQDRMTPGVTAEDLLTALEDVILRLLMVRGKEEACGRVLQRKERGRRYPAGSKVKG